MTKRAAGVSWLWPSSRPCFEHNFSVRACALSRNSVGPARTFEESKSRRKLANRKLVYALKRPRREAHETAQTTNHDHNKKHKKSTKKHKNTQTTNHDHKKAQTRQNKKTQTNKKHTKNTNYQARPQKSTNRAQQKHKLPITTTKKAQKNTNYQSRPRMSKFPYM